MTTNTKEIDGWNAGDLAKLLAGLPPHVPVLIAHESGAKCGEVMYAWPAQIDPHSLGGEMIEAHALQHDDIGRCDNAVVLSVRHPLDREEEEDEYDDPAPVYTLDADEARKLAALAVQLPGGEGALVAPIKQIDRFCDQMGERWSARARGAMIYWAVLDWHCHREQVSPAEAKMLNYSMLYRRLEEAWRQMTPWRAICCSCLRACPPVQSVDDRCACGGETCDCWGCRQTLAGLLVGVRTHHDLMPGVCLDGWTIDGGVPARSVPPEPEALVAATS